MRLLAVIFVVLRGSRDGTVAHAQDVLILTEASTAAINGSTHVTSVIAAFTNAGASVVVNTTDLTDGAAMSPALVAGRDVVIVVRINGPVIDAADVPVLQAAVNATAVLPIANSVRGWSVTLGSVSPIVFEQRYLARLAKATDGGSAPASPLRKRSQERPEVAVS